MNLDVPFKLYPVVPKEDGEAFSRMYVTADERWIIKRRDGAEGWRVFRNTPDMRGPIDVPSIDSAIREIKERLTGRPYHVHDPAATLVRLGHRSRRDLLEQLTALSEDSPGGYS